VGEVLSTEQHPDADKLRVCQVSNGAKPFRSCAARRMCAPV
jgi:phenylalanyl-tRNA synthetase beta chain